MARSAGIQTSLGRFCSKNSIFRDNGVRTTPPPGSWNLAGDLDAFRKHVKYHISKKELKQIMSNTGFCPYCGQRVTEFPNVHSCPSWALTETQTLLLEIPGSWTQPPLALLNMPGCVHSMAQTQSPGARRVSSQKSHSRVCSARGNAPQTYGTWGLWLQLLLSISYAYLLPWAEGSFILCGRELQLC